jgi:hypothetical protein
MSKVFWGRWYRIARVFALVVPLIANVSKIMRIECSSLHAHIILTVEYFLREDGFKSDCRIYGIRSVFLSVQPAISPLSRL